MGQSLLLINRKLFLCLQYIAGNLMACLSRRLSKDFLCQRLPPGFLCPIIETAVHKPQRRAFSCLSNRSQLKNPPTFSLETPPTASIPTPSRSPLLPSYCPGCGAFAQTQNADQPGFYDVSRQSVSERVSQDARAGTEGSNVQPLGFLDAQETENTALNPPEMGSASSLNGLQAIR